MRSILGACGAIIFVAAVMTPGVMGGSFSISGYENLTGPGPANLLLAATELRQEWANQTLRVEISGSMEATLLYDSVESVTDLGRFDLSAGNYTVEVYVLPELGPTVTSSGSVTYSETLNFAVPQAPEAPEPKKPLIDPESLGFMLTALFVFGLLLAIWRTTNRPAGSENGT